MNSNLPNNRGRGGGGRDEGEVAEGGELRLEGCSPRQWPSQLRVRARRCLWPDRGPNLVQWTIHYFIS